MTSVETLSPFLLLLLLLQEAKIAYESLFIVENHRPITAEFLEFEQRVFDMALSLYNYTWANGSEVRFT